MIATGRRPFTDKLGGEKINLKIDNKGRIEWVNDAFTAISGYTLDEIKGKKPKDFLQSEETDSAALKKLASALVKKENIELTLINHNKAAVDLFMVN